MAQEIQDELSASVRSYAEDITLLVRLIHGTDEDVWQEDGETLRSDIAKVLEDWGMDSDEVTDAGSVADLAGDALWEGILSVECIGRAAMGEDFTYHHCEVVLATGGPHIELDTDKRAIVGWWGSASAAWGVAEDVCSYFDERAEF